MRKAISKTLSYACALALRAIGWLMLKIIICKAWFTKVKTGGYPTVIDDETEEVIVTVFDENYAVISEVSGVEAATRWAAKHKRSLEKVGIIVTLVLPD